MGERLAERDARAAVAEEDEEEEEEMAGGRGRGRIGDIPCLEGDNASAARATASTESGPSPPSSAWLPSDLSSSSSSWKLPCVFFDRGFPAIERGGGGKGERGGCTHCHAWPTLYDHRPSHPYNARMEHVGFFTDQADIA